MHFTQKVFDQESFQRIGKKEDGRIKKSRKRNEGKRKEPLLVKFFNKSHC